MDGYIKFAANANNGKTWVVEVSTNDVQLGDYFREFLTENADDLVDLGAVEKKNPAAFTSHTLLLVTFSHRSIPSFDGETTEYEDETEVHDVLVLDANYQATWQKNLTTMYGFSTLEELKDNEALEEIAVWEEFYEEDFSFFKPVVISSPFLSLFD